MAGEATDCAREPARPPRSLRSPGGCSRERRDRCGSANVGPFELIASPKAARRLAGELRRKDRDRAIVVLTVPYAEERPLYSPEEIRGAIGHNVAIYLIETFYLAERFSSVLGEPVNNGDARIFWPGVDAEDTSSDKSGSTA